MRTELTLTSEVQTRKLPPIENHFDSVGLGSINGDLDEFSLFGALCTLDAELRYTKVSRAYEVLTRIEQSVLIGRAFSEHHPHQNKRFFAANIEKCKTASRKIIFEEFDLTHRRWLETQIVPVVKGYSVLALDITDKKEFETLGETKSSEAVATLEGLEVGVARIGLDGRWLYTNASCERILGNEHKVFQLYLRDLTLNDDFNADEEIFASLMRGDLPSFSSERQVCRPDGIVIWVHIKLSLVSSMAEQPLFFTLSIDDITERKAVTESHQFALQAAQLGTWDYDAVEDLTLRSKRFNEIFGYLNSTAPAPEKWRQTDFLRHLHPADRSSLEKKLSDALSLGQNFSAECRVLNGEQAPSLKYDRAYRWIALWGRVYTNVQGKTIRMAGLIRDITAAKTAALELQNAKLAAEDANREKSYFLANMSHEIRTPLGAIIGFSDLLLESKISSEEHDHYLQIINRNGKNLTALIDDILDLSKVEAGFLEIERAEVSVPDLVEGVTSLLNAKAAAKGLSLSVRCMGPIPARVITDPIRLRQILINVIGNAIKFTKEGSVAVCLSLAPPPPGRPPRLIFTITDSGPGIAQNALDSLFLPFTQADSSMSRRFGGTGLGLALSRRLARAMGGDLILSATSVGEGSTFMLLLPVKPVQEDATILDPIRKGLSAARDELMSATKSRQPLCLQGLKILLADDSPDNRLLIKRMLSKAGAEIVLADDGISAVDKASQQDFDIVLMDMQMPRLDGYEATRELRRAGFGGPIIALTAHAMRHDRAKCMDAGCSEYLAKPINAGELYKTIGGLVEEFGH